MSEYVVAETEYGKVRGIRTVSSLNAEYISFLGIPYAAKPLRELRFKDPREPPKWENDIYDATQEKSRCLGIDARTKKTVGSEDGLLMNIFTKSTEKGKLNPVMVYIHGGAFWGGGSHLDTYSPDYLMMGDIVLVTFNYRVGPLGFLYLNDPSLEVPGNAGLKDQQMVLKFVRENIKNFGGDADNVTLFGHSAGGCSVSWHCASESSKGLFHRAIIMSGCVLNQWALTPHRDWAVRLAKAIGYTGSDEDEKSLLEYLQKADPVKMIEVQKSLIRPEEFGKISFAFAPHIEPYTSAKTFISERPIDLLRSAWSNDIDILIGGTSDEGLMYLETLRDMPGILASFQLKNAVPVEITTLSSDDPIRLRFAEKLRETYYSSSQDSSSQDGSINNDGSPSKDELAFCKIQTDKAFWHGMQRIVQSRLNSHSKGKTFLYRFAVDSPTQNYYRISRYGASIRGVCHADEISYLFKNKYVDVPSKGTIELKSIERFVSAFTSFATTGNPNTNLIGADMENVTWKPVESQELPFKCLNFDDHLSFIILPESERLAIWNELYEETNTRLY